MDNKENEINGINDAYEDEKNCAIVYERSRIKPLAEQREGVQKKTFTNWVNSHLKRNEKLKGSVDDLFTDLRDGTLLMSLLEILSGERLEKPERGHMRIHHLENVAKSLRFLASQHVYLENVGNHDVVDGNSTLTLGLIWTIILRYQIQDIQLMDETDEGLAPRTPKEALLLWCQMKTAGYPNVNIRNFTTSWRDGLGFCALLDKHKPDVIDFTVLSKENAVENLDLAFTKFKEEYEVQSLLCPKDIAVDQPDEKSIMTYCATLYQELNKAKTTTVQGKRVGKIIDTSIQIEKMQNEYEGLCSDLLKWIEMKINWLENEPLRQSLPEVMQQLENFKDYRLQEKPPKFEECGQLEMKFFEIQSSLMAAGQKYYVPTEGKLISDVNKAWVNLEKSEHGMEIRLYEELIRQQKLDQLANRFYRKAQMRESWLIENDKLVHQDVFGSDLVTVDAAIKKHEALEGDIYAHEERINALGYIKDELKQENYYKLDEIEVSHDKILEMWRKLLKDLQMRKNRLENCREIQNLLQERTFSLEVINEFIARFKSSDYGKHILGVDSLLENHKMLVGDAKNIEIKINFFNSKIDDFNLEDIGMDEEIVKEKKHKLNEMYREMLDLADNREKELQITRKVWEFIEDLDNDKEWIKETNQLLLNPDLGHDLSSIERLIRMNNNILKDVENRKYTIIDKLRVVKEKAQEETLLERKDLLENTVNEFEELIKLLDTNGAKRKDDLEFSQIYYQLLTDIDDNDAHILEEIRIFDNVDVGDTLDLTENYLKKYEEKMIQVVEIEATMTSLSDRNNELDRSRLDSFRLNALDCSFDKMKKDFDNLKLQCKIRCDLLNKNKNKFVTIKDIDNIETWISAKEKLLNTFKPTDDADEMNVIKHRFQCFEDEMKQHSVEVEKCNDVSKELVNENVPDSEDLEKATTQLNMHWNDLADLYDRTKLEMDKTVGYNEFLVECEATCQWIGEKKKLLEWSDELGDDLDSIMQLQRRLGSLGGDMVAIEARVNHLNDKAPQMIEYRPNEESTINEEIHKVNENWTELKKMLEERDAKLNNSSQLQKFFQDLDNFNVWLSNIQTKVATQDIPKDLMEAEKFRSQHQELKEEIKLWEPEYVRLMEFGQNVSKSKDEPQYVLFNQRLVALQEGWDMLQNMYDDKTQVLQESVDAHIFMRDANQVEVTLAKQETFLANEEIPISLESAQKLDREFENFKVSVNSNRPKITSTVNYGEELIPKNALSDRIKSKSDNINERCNDIDEKIKNREAYLKNQLILMEYLDEIVDFEEVIEEKTTILSDIGDRNVKDVSSRYNRIKELERQLDDCEIQLQDIQEKGADLQNENPEFIEVLEPKLESLQNSWNLLKDNVGKKGEEIEDANREIIFEENAQNVLVFLDEIEAQIITTEESYEEIGLNEIDNKLKDQDSKDKQLETKKKILDDMEKHAIKLKEQYPDREEQFEEIQQQVKVKLTQVEPTLNNRRNKLGQQKKVRQYVRDVQDEIEWIKEKENVLGKLNETPSGLPACEQKQRRLKSLENEVDNHQPRIDEVILVGEDLINNGHPRSEEFQKLDNELLENWDNLRAHIGDTNDILNDYKDVCNYVFDVDSAKDWIEDREMDLMKDEKVKDLNGAMKALRKNQDMMKIIEDYDDEVKDLRKRYNEIKNRVPDGIQDGLERNYDMLINMCQDQRSRIDELVTLYELLLSIEDLEEWIAERTTVACNHETGNKLEHCVLLRERFAEFAKETSELGEPRVNEANDICVKLINEGHREAAQIARWKDLINEMWSDLQELIDTRIQLLKAAHDYLKFMNDSAELIELIQEKLNQIPETVGKDAKTVAAYLRKLKAFQTEVDRLQPQIDSEIAVANNLIPLYCGEMEDNIVQRRNQLQDYWYRLKRSLENYTMSLQDNDDLHRFYAMVRELLNWYQEIEIQIAAEDKPRDVCGVEIIISNHMSLKAEVDSREENRSVCLGLGRTLINNKHKNSAEIRSKCRQVISTHHALVEQWRKRKEYLDLILEVYQFAREAALAESWIIAQEPFVLTTDYGDSLSETLNLIQKHDVLERNLAVQIDRFEALRKLTKLEQLEDEEMARKREMRAKERAEKLAAALLEFSTPPPTPEPQRKSVEKKEEEISSTVVKNVESAPAPMPSPRTTSKEAPQKIDEPPATKEPKTGMLTRKHEWENLQKKAGNRAWHELFAVLDPATSQMRFYRDEKKWRDAGDASLTATYKGELGLDLIGMVASPATNYKKRNNVFRLKLANGGEYLCQTKTTEDLDGWVSAINTAAGTTNAEMEAQEKYSTLPSNVKSSSKGVHKSVTMSRKK